MSELKRYWVVVHYETELTAEDEFEAHEDICMGNTLVEQASIVTEEITSDADLKAVITQARLTARKKGALAMMISELCYKFQDYSFRFDGLPPEIQKKVDLLSLEQLEELSIAALDFNSWDDLSRYLGG